VVGWLERGREGFVCIYDKMQICATKILHLTWTLKGVARKCPYIL
jgi:hypothetical protein